MGSNWNSERILFRYGSWKHPKGKDITMNWKQALALPVKQFVLLTVIIILSLILALFIPWRAWTLSSHPHPVKSYEEAARQIEILRSDHQSQMNPDCLLQS